MYVTSHSTTVNSNAHKKKGQRPKPVTNNTNEISYPAASHRWGVIGAGLHWLRRYWRTCTDTDIGVFKVKYQCSTYSIGQKFRSALLV